MVWPISKWMQDTFRSPVNLIYVPREGYATLQQQWILLLVLSIASQSADRDGTYLPRIRHFVRCKLTSTEMAQCGQYRACICYKKLIISHLCIQERLGNTSVSMATCHWSRLSHILCKEDVKHQVLFCVQFQSWWHEQKWHSVDNTGLVYASKSSWYLTHVSKKG